MQRMEEVRRFEYLNKKKEKLDDEIKAKKEEQEDLTQMVKTLTDQRNNLKKVTQVTDPMKNIEKLIGENEAQSKILDDEIEKKKVNKREGYLQLKRIINNSIWNVKKEIRELQTLEVNTQKLQTSVETVLNKMTQWEKKIESHMEQSKAELEEVLKEKDEAHRKFQLENHEINETKN